MKKFLFIHIFFTLIGILNIHAQQFPEKEYYLVDSLPYDDLTESHQQMVDSCLKVYHASKTEYDKLSAVKKIVSDCWDNRVWPKYNLWIYDYAKQKLKNGHHLTQADKNKCMGLLAECLNNIGFLHHRRGAIDQALKYYDKSMYFSKKIGDKVGVAYGLINTGVIYKQHNDAEKAYEYFKEALGYLKTLKDTNGIALCYNNLGLIYDEKNEKDLALKYYFKSVELRKITGDKHGIAYAYSNIGGVFFDKGDDEKALEYHEKSLAIKEEIFDKKGISKSLVNIAKIAQKKNKLNKAKQLGEQALSIAQEIGYPPEIENAAEFLSSFYEAQNMGFEALKMYKLYITMRDSLNNEATQKATAKQQAKYEYDTQKTINDANHEKQLAIEHEAKKKQQILTYATGVGLGLVVIFLLFVFNRLQITRKQKLVIEEQKNEVEKQKEVVEEAHYQLEEKNQEIMDSIIYAKRIQSAILPPDKVVKKYLQNSFILYKPKDIVAGDFFWMESVAPTGHKKETTVLFAAADCTGHGVPGAMVSVVCNNALNRSVREHELDDPGEILNKTREIIIQEFEKSDEEVKDGMDIALCCLQGNSLKYAGAHNPLWIIRDGKIIETKANKQPIGKFDNPQPYKTHSFDLQKGDTIYIFSDGYVDQFGGKKGKKFKTVPFKELLLSIQNDSMDIQKQKIDKTFEEWKGELEQLDDVCVIGVSI